MAMAVAFEVVDWLLLSLAMMMMMMMMIDRGIMGDGD